MHLFKIQNWWKYNDFNHNWPDLKKYIKTDISPYSTSYELPNNVICTPGLKYEIAYGKYRKCVGELLSIHHKDYYTLNVTLKFKNKVVKTTHPKLVRTEKNVTDYKVYSKPKILTNLLGQQLEKDDMVLVPRNNEIIFGKITHIRSENSFEASRLFPGGKKSSFRVNNLKGVIKWESDMKFDEMVASLILMRQ